MVKLISPTGATITTDATPQIQRILATEGVQWFETLQNKPFNLSEKAFNEIDALISQKPS